MKRALGDIDTSALLYNPRERDFLQKIESAIPEFKTYRATRNCVTHKMFATYATLMYDLNSPLWRDEPDYYQRMYEAARLANFPKGLKKKEFSYEAERILFGKQPTANDAIIAYITKFSLPEYIQLVGYTVLLSTETRKIIASKGTSSSPKILEETGKKIRELQRFLFNTGNVDITKEMQTALYSRLERDKLLMRPEEIIKELSDTGKLPEDFSPYKEDELPDSDEYLRENMTFQGDNE